MYLIDVSLLNPTEFIQLYQIDLTSLNGGETLIFYFTSGVNSDGSAISFNSQEYVPLPCQSDGFDISNTGPLPNPTISIGNINAIFTPYMLQYKNCLGATFTRIKTFRRYLDGESHADGTKKLFIDQFRINRVAGHNSQQIQFELAFPTDLSSKKLPGRIVNRNCSHIYRKFIGGDFVAGTCPYSGDLYFDVYDNPTSQANDACGKRPNSCAARFGKNNPLPMQGFPSVQKLPY